MSRTSIPALVGLAGFCAAAVLILARRFYGAWQTVSPVWSVPLWAMAVLCGFLTVVVRRRRDQGRVGLDRSQVNPMMVANFMVVGKATAFSGAVFGGGFGGLAVWVLPRVGTVAAADDDLVGVLTGLVAGIIMIIAGVLLERSCEVSPPSNPEGAG